MPQQDPGPAQPGASPGLKPQHPVSLGPGIVFGECPVSVDVADMSLIRSEEPHEGHCGSLELEKIKSSLTWPQFSHLYSYIGIFLHLLKELVGTLMGFFSVPMS